MASQYRHLLFILYSLFNLLKASSFRFFYPDPFTGDANILVGGNATKTESSLQLTSGNTVVNAAQTSGRAIYADKIKLLDAGLGTVSSFSTSFIFRIRQTGPGGAADGMAFFLTSAENATSPPIYSGGGQLGLISSDKDGNSSNQMVAVEFDTYPNVGEDPAQHVGIDINSVKNSYKVANLSDSGLRFSNMTIMTAWIDFDSRSSTMEVRMVYYPEPRPVKAMLSGVVRLGDILGDRVWVGFSAATGSLSAAHEVLGWEFHAGGFNPETPSPSPLPASSPPELSPPVPAESPLAPLGSPSLTPTDHSPVNSSPSPPAPPSPLTPPGPGISQNGPASYVGQIRLEKATAALELLTLALLFPLVL